MARAAVLGRLNWTLGEVIELIDETPRVRSIVLDVPGWLGHLPGQHVDIRLTAEDGYQAQRSYSIASAPEADCLMLTVEGLPDGEASPYLVEELRAGDTIELRGPIGGYFVWEASFGGPLLLVAGGSGIIPFMSMLRHRAAMKSRVASRLVYSSRTWQNIIFREELENLAAQADGLEVFHTLTRTQPDGWEGYARRVDAELLAETAWSPASAPLTYVCGSTSFVETVANALVLLGHEARRVKTERFGPTGG
jgi:ferredoxin-NADP reductase